MHIFRILHFILILLLLLSHTLATPLEKVSLQLQEIGQFQFAGYYIAKEKQRVLDFFNVILKEWDIVSFGKSVIIEAIDLTNGTRPLT